jgi:hypothetical protein
MQDVRQLSAMKYIVVQIGARRSYAVPHVLAKAGCLERFYTDICGNVGFAKTFRGLAALVGLDGEAAHLRARRVPEPVKASTTAFELLAAMHVLRRALLTGDPESHFREHLRFCQKLGFSMIRAGYGSATHVYSMLGEGGPFLAEARRRGLKVISEVYIALSVRVRDIRFLNAIVVIEDLLITVPRGFPAIDFWLRSTVGLSGVLAVAGMPGGVSFAMGAESSFADPPSARRGFGGKRSVAPDRLRTPEEFRAVESHLTRLRFVTTLLELAIARWSHVAKKLEPVRT